MATVTPVFDPSSRNTALERIAAAVADPGWIRLPGFYGPEETAAMARAARARWEQGAFRPAGVGRGDSRVLRPEIRSDHVHWLGGDEPEDCVREWMTFTEDLRAAVNRVCFLGAFAYEGHFALYPAGAFYGRHLDCFRGQPRRAVTVLLYLNDAWTAEDGGLLRLYTNGESLEEYVDLLPEGGSLVVFDSARFHHEVLPARRERLSLTGWLCRRA